MSVAQVPLGTGDALIGHTLDGRYRITRFIGRGGMGDVYAAEHVGLGRTVAIKFLALTAGAELERFRREARAASRVTHEHVVQVIDVGVASPGRDYIVMEYVEGIDLQKVIDAGALDLSRALAITRQILNGLHAIHVAGIIHRDIKPANIVLTRVDGTEHVKLLDFGIAKTLDERTPLTAANEVIGTPLYTAPERYLGQCDHRADIYSVGLVLYAMLAGAPPFMAPTMQRIVAMHLADAPAPLDLVRPGIPGSVIAAISRALAKAPADRFDDALAFACELGTADDLGAAVSMADPVAPTVHARPANVKPPASKARTGPRSIDLSKDRVIDRFELIRELGRGGMGQVFLARDTTLGRRVAIKFLLHDDPTFVQRFLVEARATARCIHENIVTIHDVGEHDGLPYMVLEYLEGSSLSAVLSGDPSHAEVIELLIPVARALVRAHEDGIVHRDLKPSNISVTKRGQVKVLDFGLARMMNHEENVRRGAPDLTDSDAIVGTAQYMSPEQWRGADVDHLSDIWAVGIMFWRALARSHPAGSMSQERLALALRDLDTPFPSLATRVPGVSARLAAIADRCLAKHKAQRYQTAAALLRDLEALGHGTGATRLDEECPYRGLASFDAEHARYFFGRANEIRTAIAQLSTWPLLVVAGPSGTGKSSFIHGGIVPALQATRSWQVYRLRPARTPLLHLAEILESVQGGRTSAAELTGKLRDAHGFFGSALRAAATRSDSNILVVVDQLEELFTLCDSPDIRAHFLAALLGAADDPSSPVRVVMSVRADFLDRLVFNDELAAELSRGMFFLNTPDAINLRETVVRPAELAGYKFEEPWIVDNMMQVATSRGALPLLSFAASRLWDARDRARRLLTVEAYHRMGRVAGAFARHADEVAASIPPTSQRLLRAVFARLVTPEGTRAIVDGRELLSLAEDAREVERILDRLVAGRLILVHTEGDQGATVELVHEMLVTEWPALRHWLDESKAMRAFVDELRLAAKQWESRGRPADLIWRDATARDALANARRHVLDLAPIEREFLAAVERGAARTRRRRVAVLASIAGSLAIVITVGSIGMVRIRAAERAAQERATAASASFESEKKARDALQEKLVIIENERTAREAAERERVSAENKQRDAEAQVEAAAGEVAMSRGQLEQLARALQQKVVELEAAKNNAIAGEAATAKMLARERAEREKLEKAGKAIDKRVLQ